MSPDRVSVSNPLTSSDSREQHSRALLRVRVPNANFILEFTVEPSSL